MTINLVTVIHRGFEIPAQSPHRYPYPFPSHCHTPLAVIATPRFVVPDPVTLPTVYHLSSSSKAALSHEEQSAYVWYTRNQLHT